MTFNSTGDRTMREVPPTSKPAEGKAGIGNTPGRGRKLQKVPGQAPTHQRLGRVSRKSGARLELDAGQQRAADMIMRGFHLRTDGLGMRTQSYGSEPRGSGSSSEDWQGELMRRFLRWAVTAQRDGLSVSAALDIIVFGKSCRGVDRERRKRSGYARRNLLQCLDLYLQV